MAEEPRRTSRAAAETVAAEGGGNVRERTRDEVVRIARERNVRLSRLSEVAEGMVEGATSALRDAAPAERESVLRQVIDGVADGFSSAANATRLALQEARSRGEQFAEQDVEQAAEDLREVQRSFAETVGRAARDARDFTTQQVRDLTDHARRAMDAARPSLEAALRAATDHPVDLAKQAATTGAGAAPKAAGMLLEVVSGLLEGAAQVVGDAGRAVSERGKGGSKAPRDPNESDQGANI